MRILFLCTAHNSLSQQLFLVLSQKHSVTVEYALSEAKMREAAELAKPHLIICPFLTARVPQQVYDSYLTLIIHPGPPGDAGPSALDWLLMGDDGTEADSDRLLQHDRFSSVGRTHWGVTALQAIGEFDAGQVWAFDQFPVDINEPGLTKSSLYRGPVTQAAISATLTAIERIEAAATVMTTAFGAPLSPPSSPGGDGCFSTMDGNPYANLLAPKSFAVLSASTAEPFHGGQTHHRPLLKASQRDFDTKRHPAAEISRRIRSGDSQPGCLSAIFGPKLYLYGGVIEDVVTSRTAPGSIVATRDEALCIATCDDKGVWITHIRRVKTKTDPALWPKVPALSGLRQVCDFFASTVSPAMSLPADDWSRAKHGTFQEIYVDIVVDDAKRLAYLYFDFYNGAMSTTQCRRLVKALEHILSTSEQPNEQRPLVAVVLMGGHSYFSNGIHLNVIEAAADPALESWHNINAINDVVESILLNFPSRGIVTVAGVRGNCAAGGVALATACDVVLASQRVVLNPAYRALGLHGSEFHSLTYPARCGVDGAAAALRSMTPLSANDAHRMGLVDHVLQGHGEALDAAIRSHVEAMFSSTDEHPRRLGVAEWKQGVELTPAALAHARATELAQMAMDFWSPRSERYHRRRRDFVRKAKPCSTPLRFAAHRRREGMRDEEEQDLFDSVEAFADKSRQQVRQELSAKVMHLIQDFSPAELDWTDGRAVEVATDTASLHGALGIGRSSECLTSGAKNAAGIVSDPIFSCYYAAA
ncbi:C-type cyclin [Tolypocladium paradoxum]|uniref:C-type cyclin n=1 Tax=Tolypocladium paradoxum TaxID=94208 RepID=A0A2S4L0P1_9HYPO|nr:C-type cyclin [Tolypocladium paradoxum]